MFIFSQTEHSGILMRLIRHPGTMNQQSNLANVKLGTLPWALFLEHRLFNPSTYIQYYSTETYLTLNSYFCPLSKCFYYRTSSSYILTDTFNKEPEKLIYYVYLHLFVLMSILYLMFFLEEVREIFFYTKNFK